MDKHLIPIYIVSLVLILFTIVFIIKNIYSTNSLKNYPTMKRFTTFTAFIVFLINIRIATEVLGHIETFAKLIHLLIVSCISTALITFVIMVIVKCILIVINNKVK